jgi:hypothetical protein
MDDEHAEVAKVADHRERLAGGPGPADDARDAGDLGQGRLRLGDAGGVGGEGDPAGGGRDRGPAARLKHAQVPGAVPAHGVAGEVDTRGVDLQGRVGQCEAEDLQGIQTTPLFPVKAEGAAVGGAEDVQVGLGGVGLDVADALDAGAVQGEDDAGGGDGGV